LLQADFVAPAIQAVAALQQKMCPRSASQGRERYVCNKKIGVIDTELPLETTNHSVYQAFFDVRWLARCSLQSDSSCDEGGIPMVNKFRTMIANEQRQLMTLGLALLVFMVTLFARQLQLRDSRWSPVGRIGDGHASHASRHEGVVNHRDRTIALAASTVDPR
jgi:hypothetical protein